MRFYHHLIDSEKPYTGIDIFAVDVDQDGLQDVVCGAWWYANPTWERYEIPGVYQVIYAYDLDKDYIPELIAIRRAPIPLEKNWYFGLSSDFVWLKPIDPRNGIWEQYPIGRGAGTWPHGVAMGYLLGPERATLAVSYHSAKKEGHYPELFEVPENPKTPCWRHRVLAEVVYGEQLLIEDVDGDGSAEVVMGEHLLRNIGNGYFEVTQIMSGTEPTRLALADLTGNGKLDLIFTEEIVDWAGKKVPLSRLAWAENPGFSSRLWEIHDIDQIRCGHSLSIGDIDGDGMEEIVCGEHLPFTPYAGDARLLVYKRRSHSPTIWDRLVVAVGFEHHNGAKIINLGNGKTGIISHGWTESRFVHLWTVIP